MPRASPPSTGLFKFRKYDASEAEAARDAFFDYIEGRGELAAEQWTEFVLDWFASTRAAGHSVDARSPERRAEWWTGKWSKGPEIPRREARSEFMLDLAHTTYPQFDPATYWTKEYWDVALKKKCKVSLALESEWGDANNADVGLAMVMQDAIKLAAVAAPMKVMLLATPKSEDSGTVFDMLRTLRMKADDQSTWLCINLPWRLPEQRDRRALSRIFAA